MTPQGGRTGNHGKTNRGATYTIPRMRGASTTRVSLGDIFEVLSSKRRRYLLYYLSQRRDESVPLDELIDQLRELELEFAEDVSSRDQLSMTVHHVHLPKLAAHGLVDYDERTGRVRYQGHRLLEQWLGQTHEIDRI